MTDEAARIRALRETAESLSTANGSYVVACAVTGHRPDPVTGAEFETREDAERAAEATEDYQSAMCSLDPDRPRYRPTVYEIDDETPLELASTRSRTEGRRANGLPSTSESVTVSSGRDGEWLQMENAPLIHLGRDDGPFEDDVVARQLDVKL
ncbi:DUF7552 domain-containing protein [Haloarchaeobius sp. DFWS5]|uniref:DUF7552 domain-containing protein n=1 Tax=Haloarchaeobius sp. DFWS5 TaxID=3446114 RepID=UPI003EBCBB7A